MVAEGISLSGKFEFIIIDENCTVNGDCYRNKMCRSTGSAPVTGRIWSSLSNHESQHSEGTS